MTEPLDDAQRQSLIEQKLKARKAAASQSRIRPLNRSTAPLSAAQRRIWLLHEFAPSSPVWNRPLALRIRGPLKPLLVNKTLNEIVRRHQILRTVYQVQNNRPWQVVLPDWQVALQVRDLTEYPREQREARAQSMALAEANQTFDLSAGPMVRARLLKLDGSDFVLLVLMHHIAFDGWSQTVFVEEFHTLYEAQLQDREPALPEPPIQYGDFAAWQESKECELDRPLRYWRDQFQTLPPDLNLPVRHPSVSAGRYDGGSQDLLLSANVTESLKAFSKDHRVSLFMTLLAGFQLLLARYTDQQDIAVGVPVAGRNRTEIEKLIGCFMNVLVLRADLAGQPTVLEFLANVRENALNGFDHQELPFDRLVEQVRPVRHADRWPLFQVMFNLRNLPPCQKLPGELQIEPFPFPDRQIGGLDLSLEINETSHGLACRLTYRQGLFEENTIVRMLDHYRNLLQAMVREPNRSVWTLPMLGAEERHRLLVEWNRTETEFDLSLCLHQVFESQAALTPRAVAVDSAAGSLTYEQLNARANHLALRLRELGAAPGKLVGLFLKRCPEMVIAMLAVLKAGAAYLPLDPYHPAASVQLLVEQADLSIVLVSESLKSQWNVPVKHPVFVAPGDRTEQHQNLKNLASPSDLAYVLFTSGSTGVPKGVMICHASVVNFLCWKKQYCGLNPRDRVVQRASSTFDDSVWEIFLPLLFGARTILAESGREADNAYLIDLVVKKQATKLCLVPSQLEYFLKEPEVGKCLTLRLFTTGGETLTPELLRRFRSVFDMPLYNGYGPTECTVACTVHPCEAGPPWIGKPIANTQVYVLDRHLQPVPIGVAGELCVTGAGLAKGYLNNPEATERSFVANPFSEVAGSKLYRTGDQVRYQADGNLEFLGRTDGQVKIRGFRIECGAIESHLNSHPLIQAAAVAPHQRSSGEKILVGYLVAEKPPESRELREFLGRYLPDSMIPSRWVFLDRLPYTSSGKLDRSSLPQPEPSGLENPGGELPRTRTEAKVLQIWRELFELEDIGIHQNFFDLGGHSLLAVSLFARMERDLGIRLPLSTLFEAPTVAQLASKLELPHELTSRSLLPIQVEGSHPPLFGLHAGPGRALMYGPLSRHLGSDFPLYGLQSVGLDSCDEPLRSVEEMAAHYIREIRRVQPSGPYHLLGFCLGTMIAWEMAHQLEAQGESVRFLGAVSHDAPLLAQFGLAGHLARLIRLPHPLRSVYLLRRLRYRWRRLVHWTGDRLWHLFQHLSWPVPVQLRHWHVAEINHHAGLRYQLQKGPWCLHFFAGRDEVWKGEPDFWANLAEGGVTTHQVSGRGVDIWKEPNVQTLARQLADIL